MKIKLILINLASVYRNAAMRKKCNLLKKGGLIAEKQKTRTVSL